LEIEMNIKNIVLLLAMAGVVQGCVLTKVATVPMRLGGAVVSIIPGVGNTAHDAIDAAAESVDDIPL
jgi:copper homeostasis protein CutC